MKKVLIKINDLNKYHLKNLVHFFEKTNLNSHVVSSHWKLYGEKTYVSFSDDFSSAYIKAEGFDDLLQNSIINILKNLPIYIYLRIKYYPRLSKKLLKTVQKIAIAQNRVVSYNVIKQALSINSIINAGINLDRKNIAIIGDGNGFLGLLIKNIFPSVKIVQINLAKMLIFDYIYTSSYNCKYKLNFVVNKNNYSNINDFNFVPAEKIFEIGIDNIDFFINIASMQEMNPNITKKYFKLIRNQNKKEIFFYCCNREEKKLPDGKLAVFKNYNWASNDKIIFDETCDWYFKYPVSRPPFVKKFDGIHRHRLIKINTL